LLLSSSFWSYRWSVDRWSVDRWFIFGRQGVCGVGSVSFGRQGVCGVGIGCRIRDTGCEASFLFMRGPWSVDDCMRLLASACCGASAVIQGVACTGFGVVV